MFNCLRNRTLPAEAFYISASEVGFLHNLADICCAWRLQAILIERYPVVLFCVSPVTKGVVQFSRAYLPFICLV